jgi:hypothetical protein
MYKNICFFNHWHNGDVFSTKGYVKDLMRQMPYINFQYAQKNTNKLILDLNLEEKTLHEVPTLIWNDKFVEDEHTLYINTWIGGYLEVLREYGHAHSNWLNLHTVWMSIYEKIENIFNIKLSKNPNPIFYIPETEWSRFNLERVYNFLKDKKDIIVFSNGEVKSNQSNLSNLETVIKRVAILNPEKTIVCTSRIDNTNIKNIFITDDILFDVEKSDLNEIAFLCTRSKLIIGKNSGAYIVAQNKDTLYNENISFLGLSHRPTDSFLYGVNGFTCNYYHHCHEDDNKIVEIIQNIVHDKNCISMGRLVVV